MQLLLMRHGKAEDVAAGSGSDRARRLTEKGRERTRDMARVAVRMDCLPEVVVTSPRVRARETAEIFCETAALEPPVVEPWLDCGMAPAQALRELAAYDGFARVMIVGHEPDFSILMEALLGAPGGRVECKKGSLAEFEIRPPSVTGVLRFLIPPKVAS